ncbi:glycerol-3-phosphate responsive antiterminator [Paenibacillus ginsengihumi]|uniref:glycerol-3-phosphate responsive antiterminator n=1 Tax=Paenibacillus ginsengihumi TaxID=431596 RepID=UPI00036BC0C3|nr:glycerol-3-phosphate responsive antiterminator [Paenibacillus ginsengihumi]
MADSAQRALPLIASVTRPEQIEAALKSKVERVNLMTGNILSLADIVRQFQETGKQVYIHLEMVDGIGRDSSSVLYLARTFHIQGIVSTKSGAIAAARQAGIRSIQRIFAIDTAAVETAVKMIGQARPDEVELMPGLMPRVIRDLKQRIGQPLIVGGLIRTEEEIRTALASGADYVSIGDKQFW